MDYYYSLDNQPHGPVPLTQLHELFRAGVITLDTLVVPVGGSEWKAYKTVEVPPQDLAGSAVPGDIPPAGSTPPPVASTSGSTPTPPAMLPSSAGATSPPPSAAQPGYKNLVLISWILLGVTTLLSLIPIVGCFSWVMLIPVLITCVVLGVMTLQRGGTTEGVLILIASVVVLPLFTLIAPILTTALFGAVTGLGDENKSRSSPTPAVIDASPTPGIVAAPRATASPASGATGDAGATFDAPPPAAARQMVNATMISFTNAVNSGSFDAFYRNELSDRWKKEVTPEKLRSIFKVFIDRKVDLTPIFAHQPVLDEAPYVDGNGLLTLVGHYPFEEENVRVDFELAYSREAKWALSGIEVNIKPINE